MPASYSSALTAPTMGFWPNRNWPFTTPSAVDSVIGCIDTSAVSLGMKP